VFILVALPVFLIENTDVAVFRDKLRVLRDGTVN
jgi:hypothetical protein